MLLEEAVVGGVVYADWFEGEADKPEGERIAFEYRALTNREKIDLLHRTSNAAGLPNGADVCALAVTKIRNLQVKDGEGVRDLDTIPKLLAFKDAGNKITYSIELAGMKIWRAQAGEDVSLKNSV